MIVILIFFFNFQNPFTWQNGEWVLQPIRYWNCFSNIDRYWELSILRYHKIRAGYFGGEIVCLTVIGNSGSPLPVVMTYRGPRITQCPKCIYPKLISVISHTSSAGTHIRRLSKFWQWTHWIGYVIQLSAYSTFDNISRLCELHMYVLLQNINLRKKFYSF